MISNFWSRLLRFEFILCKNWNKPHFLSNDYLFWHKSHLDKILSFLHVLAKNQIWKIENALSMQKTKKKINHLKIRDNSHQKTTCTRQMSRPIFLVLFRWVTPLYMQEGGGKRAKNSPKWRITITSVTCQISRTLKHMIMIFGALVLNDDISKGFFRLLNFSYFGLLGGGGGGSKRAKNSPKWKITITSVMCHISGTV